MINILPRIPRVEFEGDSIQGLIKLLNRALNTWPEAPKELIDLADILTHGEPLLPTSAPD